MRKLNWGDELCGVRVTPESWAGSVIDFCESGEWRIQADGYKAECDACCAAVRASCPIYPPEGWAGATEAELWEAVMGEGSYTAVYGGGNERWAILLDCDGSVELDAQRTACTIDPDALIAALQRAKVLQARLRGAK